MACGAPVGGSERGSEPAASLLRRWEARRRGCPREAQNGLPPEWQHRPRSRTKAERLPSEEPRRAVGAGFEPAEGVNPQSLSRRSRYGRFGTPP